MSRSGRIRARAGRLCHTCGGIGFYFVDGDEGDCKRFPVRCHDCSAFYSLGAATRLAIRQPATAPVARTRN
jgi:hypothetical protein